MALSTHYILHVHIMISINIAQNGVVITCCLATKTLRLIPGYGKSMAYCKIGQSGSTGNIKS